MSLRTLMSRIARRGSRRSSKTDRTLAYARTDEALRLRRQRDETHQDYRTEGMAGGGF